MHLSEDRLACVVEAVIDQYADRIRLSCASRIWTLVQIGSICYNDLLLLWSNHLPVRDIIPWHQGQQQFLLQWTTIGRSAKQTDFPLPVGNETNTSFPCRNVVIASTWLVVSSSYPASLQTSSITLCKHCGSTENPNKGTFIAPTHPAPRYACDYM